MDTVQTKLGPNGGKVLRLHFACHAELPIGSSLRVTSSTLWAPGSLANAHDSSDASYADSRAATSEGQANSGQEDLNSTQQSYVGLYASSVEMVTSPEEYPLWRTKNPVIVIANGNDNATLNHRYRYMVVTPGADADYNELNQELDVIHDSKHRFNSSTDVTMETSESTGANASSISENELELKDTLCTTSNDMEGAFPVMMWEDPFHDDEPQTIAKRSRTNSVRQLSYVSLASLRKTKQIKNLANLPFRTLTIKTNSIDNMTQVNNENKNKMDDDHVRYTSEGVRIDTWNCKTDEAFQSFVEREQSRKKNAMQSTSISSSINSNEDMSDVDSENKSHSIPITEREPPKKKERLFLVCFHLPVTLTKDPQTQTWNATWNESLLSKSPNSVLEKSHILHFVGHVSDKDIESEQDKIQIRQALAPMGCTPLFLEKELLEAHYLGMCKQVLWPAFHNIDLLDLSTSGWGQREHLAPSNSGGSNLSNSFHNKFRSAGTKPSSPSSAGNSNNLEIDDSFTSQKVYSNVRSTIESFWDQSILDKWWGAYTIVNQTFADALVELLQPGDTTWVHDYHLALLPNMLDTRERTRFGRRTSKMVFFLHIPFPTSQIFRELECGEAILQGMLHADVIGFHAFDHARHFLNAGKRILGLNYESLVGGLIGVQYRGKKVLVTMSNVSIEPDVVDEAITFPSVVQGTADLESRHKDRVIISGVDIAQRLSGITFKLLAFERLLTDYPIWKDKAVMVQRCLIPGSRRADETNTIREVRFLIRRIQEKFGRHVIDYQELKGSNLPIEQRIALWRAADVLMLSPVREGLNMIPMEYVYARKAPLAAGVTIASEFSAVCSILNGALRVNPFDIQLTAANIDKALSMEVKEKESRRARDIDFVSNFPKDKWTLNVLRDLDEAIRSGDDDDDDGSEEKKRETDAIDSTSTAAFLAREYELSFSHLNHQEVKDAYDATTRRVILLDFNGTIVIKEPPGKYLKREILGTSGLKPPSSVIKALTELVSDPRNAVYVVSGDAQENVENAIGHIAGLGLAASNGALFSNPVQPGESRRTWQSFDLGVDFDAVKRVSLPVLSKYTARTNGSFVKLTHSSIGWSYYSCDPEWGALQASHLVLELENELRAFDVRFVTLKGIVEIVPRRLNKGLIVKKVLQEVAAKNGGQGVDFILCMGDDISDEKMFTSVFSFVAEMEEGQDEKSSNERMYCYTTAVGKKASHASQYVDDAKDVANLLVSLTGRKFDNRSLSFDEVEMGSDFFA